MQKLLIIGCYAMFGMSIFCLVVLLFSFSTMSAESGRFAIEMGAICFFGMAILRVVQGRDRLP